MTDFKKRITSSDVLTFDPEESLLRGQIPLKEFRDILKNHDETKVTKISFSRNGYCNDAVLKLIQSYKKKDYENLLEVKLDGCFLITNAGIKWLSDVLQGAKNLKKITLDGCKDLTDNELYLIAKTMGPFCVINMRGTSLRYITDIERNRVSCLGCTILGTDSIVDMKDSHAVIVPHDSIENSLAHLIMEKKTVKRQTFHHMTDFKTDGNWNFTLTELSLTQPLFDVVVSRNLSQVIIPFNGAADTQDVKKHVTDTVLKILSKTPFVGSYRKTQEQLEETSNPPYHYGTAHLKLMPLVYLRDIKKQMVPIVDSDGNEKGQLECCIMLEEQDQSLKEEEKSKQAVKLVGQELRFKLKINFGKGLSPDLQSSYCRFKFFHVINHYISTSEIVGSSPYYNYERDFVIRSVRQKVIKYFEASSLIIEVWGRDRKDGKMSADSQETSMTEPQSVYKGCEFIILETGNKPEGLDRVKIKADDFSRTLKQINDCIVQHEQNLQYLDLHGQRVYSSLYEMKEKIEEFCRHIDTIHYMSTEITTIQGAKILVDKMIDIMENNKYHQEIKYSIPQKNKRILNIVLDIIKADKIVEFGSGAFSSDERNLKIPGLEIFELAKTLHEQGKIGFIAIGSKTVFVDIEYLEAMMLKLTEKSNMQSCKQLSTSVGDSTKVWTSNTAESHFLGENKEKSPTDLIMEILKEYLGLIQIPAWRLQPTDPQYLYTVNAALSAPDLPLNDFWRKEEKDKNIITMKKLYSVLHSASHTLLAGILSSSTEYGRTILLSADGAVFQIGCVQTAVLKESDNNGKLQISVESRCYFPEVKSEPVNGDTEFYTKEYTWNIFCLYTDIIDKVLKQSLVVYTLWSNIPQEFVNVSVGCSHSWGPNFIRPRQTVCTLCNKCTDKGRKCQYNGMIGDYLRECLCKADISGCASCGICVQCVERLWDIRSYLRPLAACPNIGQYENKQAEKNDLEPEDDQKIELVENPFEELAMNAEILNEEIEVQSHEKTVDFIQSELDPIANNEFEVQHIADGILGIVLKEIDTGEMISVYPGKATAIIMDENLKESEIAQNISRLSSNMEGYKYKFYPGDSMKIRITDPFRTLQREKSTSENISQESKVVYHTAVCTKAMISHETGILCYHEPLSQERSSHKAYFIGSRPFCENFKSFSIKILEIGEQKYIGIGVSADRSFQLSERSGRELRQANFIKYYINKGGIYNTGRAIVQKDGSNIGDVITVNCDVTTNKLKFLRNDVVFYEVAFEMPEGGYYPQISMNSEGECVQLMEKNPWMPDLERVRDLKKPTAFHIYKYSDLWISPGKTLMMTMKRIKKPTRTVRQLRGWIILHNPTDQLVLYMIQPNNYIKRGEGCLKPGESLPIPVSQQLQNHGLSPLETGIKIVWLKVAENKPYSTEDVIQMFEKANKADIGQHRLNCVGESNYSGDTETLPLFNEFQNPLEEIYKLEVYKNCELVTAYCLRKGKYMVDVYNLVPGKTAKYILKRPKCPSFLYPASVRRGMKVIFNVDSGIFAEAVVTGKVDRDYSLEYTPYGSKDSTKKVTWILKDKCVGIEDLDWQNRTDVISMKDFMKYSKSVDSTLLYETYIPAPPYLTTKGSAFMLNSINPKWQTDTLKLFSSCKQSNTRPTIQEQAITVSSRTLLKWVTFPKTSNSSIFLPSTLDDMTLKHPKVTTMFSDVKINRLCCVHEKYFDQKLKKEAADEMDRRERLNNTLGIIKWKLPNVKSLYNNTRKNFISIEDGLKEKTYKLKKPQEICVHFMDIPGFPVKQFVPVDLSYGCLYQSWTYVALLAYQLSVPSFDQLISTKGLERKQIESLLYQLIQPYASLCCIYSTQYGGLPYQQSPANYTDGIDDLYMDSQIALSVIDDQGSYTMMKDTNKFKRVLNFLACKAHSNGMRAQNLFPLIRFSLEKEFYHPYSENLSTLLVNGVPLDTLPDDVFQTFRKLKVFAITDVPMEKTPIFPSGMSKCTNLEIVFLSGMHGLKELPSDVILGPSLRIFHIYHIPIKKLNIDWPVSSLLTSLTLTGLLLEEVPVKISNLHRLEELILDYNPITSIPEEIGRLKKLKILSMKGIPWIHLQQKSEMPKAMYTQWYAENSCIRNYYSEEEFEELFSKFDLNNNSILDQHELARLNMYLLLNIPRIGLKSLGDKEYGGIPPAIFRLKSLEQLNLSYTAITMVPYQAKNLLELTSLNLGHCPLLEGISGDVGLLPNLKSINLNNCPSLETPPQDIVGRGVASVKAFLKRIAGGFIECHRTKLMFIGLGQAGKTTLLNALRSEKKKTEKTEDVELTDGIDIIPWIVPVEHEGRKIDITYSCWDFAGQTVYYNTHQFFLSKQAVYVLLWNMRMGFEHAGLDFWLSSVACHCPDAPVIIVGTQLDQIPMPDMPEAELMEKYPQIKKFCYVSSTAGTNIAELEQTLTNVTMHHCSQMTMKIPKVWLSFENGILKERNEGRNIMEWSLLRKCAINNGIYDDSDIRLAVDFLNDLGTVQHFDTEFLRDRVVINPQWIVDVMAKVVSVNEKAIKENLGRFYHSYIPEIWKDYDKSLHQWMLKLTETFDLTFPLPGEKEKYNIVPCLLPETKPLNLPWPYLSEEEEIREKTILYKFAYLPSGLFNRAQARLFSQGFTDHDLLQFLWKKGSILKKNQHYALVRQLNDYEMIVSVQGPRPKNVLDLIHETLTTLISEAFDGVHYDYFIQCPDCVEKEGTKEPFLFKAELISRAYSVNAPFLQCTKFFHTVSIGELLRIMPDNKETEFDAQMQESISTLEEISRNIAQDVAILYCNGDLPSLPFNSSTTAENAAGMTVDPRNIHEDLKKTGYKCWFPEDIDNISDMEMTMALKNSKVLVACMSDRFVNHEKCHRWFLYAIEQLHKPFAIAVMNESLEWKHTDIGFKIGNPDSLPEVLYLQMDNCGRENKNRYLMSFLAFLVELKVFRKIKLSFLMVGHTHEDIDQMFSRFSIWLNHNSCKTMDSLMNGFQNCYNPKPTSIKTCQVYNYSEWITPYLAPMSGHSKHHVYKFKLENGKTKMVFKEWTTTKAWRECEGSDRYPLLRLPTTQPKLLQPNFQDLDKVENSILGARKYIDKEDMIWWERFFQEKHNEELEYEDDDSSFKLFELARFVAQRPLPDITTFSVPEIVVNRDVMPPRFAMIKNMKRYSEKIKDLIDIIKGHMDIIEKMKLKTPEVFISYCWANSQEACSITTEAKDGSIGYGDPRVMKTHLEKNGIRCWMDIEQMGKYGLYQDITVGLQNSRVLVICVSDEYLESDACMMEARFGVHNLYLPIVVCIVGTGKLWKESEVSLMIKKQPELATVIKMQKETPDVYDEVLTAVKNYLLQPETDRQKKVREKLEKAKTKLKKKGKLEEKLKQQGDTNLSFQEEVELIQRKFMRYVTKLSMMEDTYIPRLLVVDLHDKKHSTNSLMDNLQQYGNPVYIDMVLKAMDEAYTGDKAKAKEEIEKIQCTITALENGNEENLPSELKWALQLVHIESKKLDGKFYEHDERNSIPLSLKERLLPEPKEKRDLEIKRKEQFKIQYTQRILSNISAILEDSIDDEWKERNLNLRVLCEYEQGWHFYGITVDLEKFTGKENLMKVLKDISPYLSRFYAILKQNGVDLHCMESLSGENFLKFIQKEGSTKNFTEAYRALRKVIEDYSELDKSWLHEFWRCCLPNGKIAYLCKDHMSKVGATKIQHGTRQVRHVLTDQDKHFKEALSENPVILQLKQEGITMKDHVVKKIEPKTTDDSKGENAEDQNVPSENKDSRLLKSRESSAESETSQQSTSSKRSQKSQRRTSQACSLQ